jgi:hypothetical protein
MPLSGRDGGRDVIVQAVDGDQLVDRLVYQVKLREKSPLGTPTADELYIWIRNQIRREKQKVLRLVSRGMQEYILATNVPASGDLDTGLRDRVSALLRREYPIPSTVWWREDLDTRLRAYPEIAARCGLLTGGDALRNICITACEDGDSASNDHVLEAREFSVAVKAVKSYCAEQYVDDQVLRFSQVDLDPVKLLDLFIDVPLTFADARKKLVSQWNRALAAVNRAHQEMLTGDDEDTGDQFYAFQAAGTGAADFFLLNQMDDFQYCLVEGAPGQGKSTVSQYICQIHRARILGKDQDLQRLPSQHRHCDVRVPFRVELRRYAAWLLDHADSSQDGILSYVSSTIRSASELEFENSHLVSLLCGSPCIIVLDGLDEVADVATRANVVERISNLRTRLEAWHADVEVVVTSRPSVLATQTPLLDDGQFIHLALTDLPISLIQSYAQAWITLKKLSNEKATEVRNVLTNSFESEHVADLARNPMQLAILLYLIFTHGRSLPEKRTALYGSYISTFQARESDKSLPVSKYGDLLLNIHGYVAWLLHCRAELGRSEGAQGDIATDELKAIVADYLEFESYERSLADQIFDGVQRFFVLVERVEGRFEFEVQPLREFFAARYLYTTSPSSFTVEEPKGTRPDRLDALLRNPYWLNVLRFFVGFYQKGELADLARRLIDLIDTPIWGLSSRTYELMRYVLLDYSMYQSRRDTAEVARALASKLGTRLIAGDGSSILERFDSRTQFTDDTGRKEVVEVTRALLGTLQPEELSRELGTTLERNDPQSTHWWLDQWKSNADNVAVQEMLARVGIICGAIANAPLDEAKELFDPNSSLGMNLWIRCVEAGRHDVADLDSERASRVQNVLEDGPFTLSAPSRRTGWLSWLGYLIRTPVLTHQLNHGRTYWTRHPRPASMPAPKLQRLVPYHDLSCRLVSIFVEARWIKDWNEVLGAVSDTFGEHWTSWRAGFSSLNYPKTDRRTEPLSFLDFSRPQVERLQGAISNRDSEQYWMNVIADTRLQRTENYGVRLAVTAACLLWAPCQILNVCLPSISRWWADFDDFTKREVKEFCRLAISDHERILSLQEIKGRLADFDSLDDISPGLSTLLGPRLAFAEKRQLIDAVATRSSPGEDAFVDGQLVDGMVDRFVRSRNVRLLEQIYDRYQRCAFGPTTLEGYQDRLLRRSKTMANFPVDLAERIIRDSDHYPRDLVEFADYRLSIDESHPVVPLRRIANNEGWFAHDADGQLDV